jgi:hypothetical protein
MPHRNNPHLVAAARRPCDHHHATSEHARRIDPHLAIVLADIDPVHSSTGQDHRRVIKVQAALLKRLGALFAIIR